jgi:hypothetical protein
VEEIIQYSKTFAPQVQTLWNQAHAPLLRAFQRHQEHDLEHPSSLDLITTKQNKIPSFMDIDTSSSEDAAKENPKLGIKLLWGSI